MIEKLKAFIATQQERLQKQSLQTQEFQIKLVGAAEFLENALKPFIEECDKNEQRDTVSEEPEAK